jgi:hypothetical protein
MSDNNSFSASPSVSLAPLRCSAVNTYGAVVVETCQRPDGASGS